MKVHILKNNTPRCNKPMAWNIQSTTKFDEVTCKTCKILIRQDLTGVYKRGEDK